MFSLGLGGLLSLVSLLPAQVTFDFENDGALVADLDGGVVGSSATANLGDGTVLTLTTVDILYPEYDTSGDTPTATGNLLRASVAGSAVTNISSQEALGINNGTIGNTDFEAFSGGTEGGDFNSGEAWVFSFDRDVTLSGIELESQDANTSLVILVDGNQVASFDINNEPDVLILPLQDLVIAAGTPITLSASGPLTTTNFRIESLEVTVASGLPDGLLTVESTRRLGNPEILGYNMGHFVETSNALDFWRYSGVNGARMFLSPGLIEDGDDNDIFGDGVTDQASFLARRDALRADQITSGFDNTEFINWPVFLDHYENSLNGSSSGGNRFLPNTALHGLRSLGIQMLIQITGSESRLPIENDNDWAGKWEFWQHFYAQAFYLGTTFDVERYQMFNEPNHPNADGLTQANWLMRLQLASDAIQVALADVNERSGKSLTPLIYGPVNSGGDQYEDWGRVGVQNRHTNFLGVTDPDYLVMHRYDYHQYNDTPDVFASEFSSIRNGLDSDMDDRFPTSISEFNVHTNGTFETLDTTIDTPALYTRLGAISARLARNNMDELYLFKFGQTNNAGARFPVTKNGTHYAQNQDDTYIHGGATRAAEVWRLFNKAHKPGGDQLRFNTTSALDELEMNVTFVPETNCYYIFSSNEESGVPFSVNVSAWGLPAGSPFLLEEVSEDYYGTVRRWGVIGDDQILRFDPDDLDDVDIVHPTETTFLITIPAAPIQTEELITASFDSTVTDGTNASTSFSTAETLLARNDPDSRDGRSASLIQFELPLIYPPDIQLAVIELEGRHQLVDPETDQTAIQAHLYALDDDSWADNGEVTWATAPNLQQGVASGALIENRYIADQGESAYLQGQLVFNRNDYRSRMVEVTPFLKEQRDLKASFLISQDPRWDLDISTCDEDGDCLVGDTQLDGLEIRSVEGGSGPQLRIVRLLDSDQDGISDEAEVQTFNTNPNLADADGDNLNDAEELLRHQTDPGNSDSDQDGFLDGDEVIAGTDPLSQSSFFTISEITRLENGDVSLSWQSVAGRTYRIYRSTTLDEGDWGELVGDISGDGNVLEFVDTLTNDDKVFYRLAVGMSSEN